MKLLIGTKNPGKFAEMAQFLGPDLELVSLRDLSDAAPDVAETAKTLEANAILKARTYFAWSGIPTVADDAGLEIDALGGEPGVMSRRWPTLGELATGIVPREKTDEEMIAMALERLAGVPREQRTARLVMVGAFHDGRRTLTASAAIEGIITERQMVQHTKGYPFRSIFWVPQFGKTYEELTEAEHAAVNHRREAYGKLRQLILS